jgi:hypothetical protein
MYLCYAGPLPGATVGSAWTEWDRPAPRAWVAQVLWQALASVDDFPLPR